MLTETAIRNPVPGWGGCIWANQGWHRARFACDRKVKLNSHSPVVVLPYSGEYLLYKLLRKSFLSTKMIMDFGGKYFLVDCDNSASRDSTNQNASFVEWFSRLERASLQCRRILGERNLVCVRIKYCCSRHLWFYDSGRLGRVEIVTLTVGARAKEGKGAGGKEKKNTPARYHCSFGMRGDLRQYSLSNSIMTNLQFPVPSSEPKLDQQNRNWEVGTEIELTEQKLRS